MIESIIFDFGDVFINLDKEGFHDNLRKLGLKHWGDDMTNLNCDFEKGNISKEQFLRGIQKQIPEASIAEIEQAWITILLDFPPHRLNFLEEISIKCRTFLLSNTDSIHINWFKTQVGEEFYNRFYNCFEKVYYSFDMGLRKPDVEIYKQVIRNHNLTPQNTLFVDDKQENTDVALLAGLKVWTLQVGKEDVTDLLSKLILL